MPHRAWSARGSAVLGVTCSSWEILLCFTAPIRFDHNVGEIVGRENVSDADGVAAVVIDK